MSRYVDGLVLVVAQNRTSRRSLSKIRRVLTQVRAPLIGSILNGAVIRKSDNYGYYGYYAYSDGKSSNGAKSHARSGGTETGASESESVRSGA
jgi:Mrp family chromosome partitioning ATPase